MSSDLLYGLPINSSWLFLGGWTALLIAASLIVFEREGRPQTEERNGVSCGQDRPSFTPIRMRS
jgi:hypothetical protein